MVKKPKSDLLSKAMAFERANRETAERYLADPVNYPKGSVYHTWALKILRKPEDFELESPNG